MTAPARPAPPLRVRDLGRLAYPPALAEQRAAHAAVVAGNEGAVLLLVEHDPSSRWGAAACATACARPNGCEASASPSSRASAAATSPTTAPASSSPTLSSA